jgi:hypothetical protein
MAGKWQGKKVGTKQRDPILDWSNRRLAGRSPGSFLGKEPLPPSLDFGDKKWLDSGGYLNLDAIERLKKLGEHPQ